MARHADEPFAFHSSVRRQRLHATRYSVRRNDTWSRGPQAATFSLRLSSWWFLSLLFSLRLSFLPLFLLLLPDSAPLVTQHYVTGQPTTKPLNLAPSTVLLPHYHLGHHNHPTQSVGI
jgi:hypothetical protein